MSLVVAGGDGLGLVFIVDTFELRIELKLNYRLDRGGQLDETSGKALEWQKWHCLAHYN
jgi:hypothetical protein